MNRHSATVFDELRRVDTQIELSVAPQKRIERLPFTIRVAQNEQDLRKAVAVRHSAYARHLPSLAATLTEPEDDDNDDESAILLAESKLDGSPLGSVRIQTNRYAPSNIEETIDLPEWLSGQSLADIRRLGVYQGRGGRLVRMVLFKACLEFCKFNSVEWMILAAKPPLDRMYSDILFSDAFPERGLIPLPRAGYAPHRVMVFEMKTGEQRLTDARHPLLDFFYHTHHPDVDVRAVQKKEHPNSLANSMASNSVFGSFPSVSRQ